LSLVESLVLYFVTLLPKEELAFLYFVLQRVRLLLELQQAQLLQRVFSLFPLSLLFLKFVLVLVLWDTTGHI
jgi:hypothetical protein